MIAYFAKHPTAANLLMLVFLLVGALSLGRLRRETFPDITPTKVEVQVIYPGASAEDVEEAICRRIEDAIDGINYVKEVISEAREGVGIVTVEMEDAGNIQRFLSDVETEVDAIDDFPQITEKPVIRQLGRTDQVLTVLVAGPMTDTDLKAYCEDLKDRLQQQERVSLVKLQGFSDRQFRVELSREALLQYNLSVAAVADILGKQSINLPSGVLETAERDLLLRFVEERRSAEELEQLVIMGGPQGAEVRLGQLGRVVDLFEVQEDRVYLNGRRAGLLQVEKTKTQDTIRVAEVVKEFIAKEQQRHPQLDIRVTQDLSLLVNDRLEMLLNNGWQGLILVFLTLWLFFNLRLSFWVAASLPVSFFGAFFLMPYLGLTVNMLTMVGLLLALGLLMDDGIVIAENVATHLARGKSAMRAAIDGTREVQAGVVSSFATTVCVLGPLAFIEGDIGKVLKVVPMILILVLAVSLVEAFLILPSHLGHSLKHVDPNNPGRFRRVFDTAIEWVRENVVGRGVDVLLRWRYLFVGGVIGLFFLSVSLMAGGVLRFQPFPDLDGDVVVARLLLPQGTPLHRTEEVVRHLSEALDRVDAQFTPKQPGGRHLVQATYVRFNLNADAFEAGPHVATVFVDLLTAEDRNARVDDVIQTWRDEIGHMPDVIGLVIAEPSLGPAGRAIEIRLRGENLETLKAGATDMLAWLGRFKGVYNLSDDLRPGKDELRLKLREGALGLGVNAGTLAQQLRAAFHGMTASEIQVGSVSYEIDVQLDRSGQNSLADLEYFQVALTDGRRIPLSAVATVEYDRGRSRIARVDGMRAVTVRGDIDSRVANTAQILAAMQKEFLPEFRAQYPETDITFEGEAKQGGTTQRSMMFAMLTGFLFIFLLLSFEFRSFYEPIIVMVAIPLALIGVLWGHLLMGCDISMPSMLGFVSLSGIVVNDSILLVIFLKLARQEGKDLMESASQASRQRFRAIMLTSLTTIAGLMPLLFERNLQAQVLIPLVVSISFGLMASTLLVLLVIPSLYVILGDFGLTTTVEESESAETSEAPAL